MHAVFKEERAKLELSAEDVESIIKMHVKNMYPYWNVYDVVTAVPDVQVTFSRSNHEPTLQDMN